MSNPKKVFLATPLNSEGREFKEFDFLIREKEFRLEPHLMNSVHWHDYYEVEFITGGEGCHFFNSHMHSIYRGCAYLIAPSDFHTVSESKDNPLGLYTINFAESFLPPKLAVMLENRGSIAKVVFSEEETAEITDILRKIKSEFEGSGFLKTEMIRADFSRFVIMLLRKSVECGREIPSSPQYSDSVSKTVMYLKNHFREHITLTDCAAKQYLTPNYLGEIFHSNVGMSFKDYLKKLRFNYSVNLLSSTEMSVAQISADSGFSTTSYFISLFREHYGITPSQFRKLSLAEQKKILKTVS